MHASVHACHARVFALHVLISFGDFEDFRRKEMMTSQHQCKYRGPQAVHVLYVHLQNCRIALCVCVCVCVYVWGGRYSK